MAKNSSFKVAADFVDYLRLHIGRGRVAVNQTQLAGSLRCGPGALKSAIECLLEAKVINRSPEKGPDGFEYWFTDEYRDEMRSVVWRDKLAIVLQINKASNQKLSVGQVFATLNDFLREMKRGLEQRVDSLQEEVAKKTARIEELEKEVSDKDSEVNTISFKSRELEAAYREAVASLNISEQKVVSLERAINVLMVEAENAGVGV